MHSYDGILNSSLDESLSGPSRENFLSASRQKREWTVPPWFSSSEITQNSEFPEREILLRSVTVTKNSTPLTACFVALREASWDLLGSVHRKFRKVSLNNYQQIRSPALYLGHRYPPNLVLSRILKLFKFCQRADSNFCYSTEDVLKPRAQA